MNNKQKKRMEKLIDIDLNENAIILSLISLVGLVDEPKLFIFKFLKNEYTFGIIFMIFIWHTILLNREKRKLSK